MPMRPGHACVPGCPEIVPAGQRRCPAHTKAQQRSEDKRRGSRHERQYGTPWDKLRKAWFATTFAALGRRPVLCGDRMSGPSAIDSRCVADGRTTTGRVLDHIVRRERGGPDAVENFQTLCDLDHNVKRQRESRGER